MLTLSRAQERDPAAVEKAVTHGLARKLDDFEQARALLTPPSGSCIFPLSLSSRDADHMTSTPLQKAHNQYVEYSGGQGPYPCYGLNFVPPPHSARDKRTRLSFGPDPTVSCVRIGTSARSARTI
jgi:hypothetical protein